MLDIPAMIKSKPQYVKIIHSGASAANPTPGSVYVSQSIGPRRIGEGPASARFTDRAGHLPPPAGRSKAGGELPRCEHAALEPTAGVS